MKYIKYIYIPVAIATLSVAVIKYSNNSVSHRLFSNIASITSTETAYIQYCRCHNDGGCYGGNMISFRPLCGTYNEEVIGPDDPINNLNCNAYDKKCKE